MEQRMIYCVMVAVFIMSSSVGKCRVLESYGCGIDGVWLTLIHLRNGYADDCTTLRIHQFFSQD